MIRQHQPACNLCKPHIDFQVHQPIISQGSSVTKITFEGHQPPTVSKVAGVGLAPKPGPPLPSLFPAQVPTKTAVADILKMSMMEAQIDTSVDRTVAESPASKALPAGNPTGEADSAPASVLRVATVGTGTAVATSVLQPPKRLDSASSPPAVGPSLLERKQVVTAPPTASQFIRIQNIAPKKAEEIPTEILIQVSNEKIF